MTTEKMQNLVGKTVRIKDKNTGELWDERRVTRFEVGKTAILCVLSGKWDLIVNVKEYDFLVV